MNSIVTNEAIYGFFGEYRFLSNFYPAFIYYEGIHYPSVENAYQAAKTLDKEKRKEFTGITASESKKKVREFSFKVNYERPDFHSIKLSIMEELIFIKFGLNSELGKMLLNTEKKELLELNWWNDRYWGCVLVSETPLVVTGENHLGRILMNVRQNLK